MNSTLCVENIYIFGWPLSLKLPSLKLSDVRVDTVYSLLCDVEQLQLCTGVDAPHIGVNIAHPVLHWKDQRVITTTTFHCGGCTLIVPPCNAEESSLCGGCIAGVHQNENCVQKNVALPSLQKHQIIFVDSDKNSCITAEEKEEVVVEEDDVEVDEDFHSTLQGLFKKDKHLLNPWQKLFIDQQVKNANCAPTARRYHPDIIRWAIELYSRSPSAYQHLRTSGVLSLPSQRTIAEYRNSISPTPGISEKALDELDRVTSIHNDVQAYITLDEMKIRESLVIRNGRLVGFVDYGQDLHQKTEIASQLLAFYLRSSEREISIPLAWYPTNSTEAYVLAFIFWKLLWECESRGVAVIAVICDGHPTNRKFLKLLHKQTTTDLYTAPNPYAPNRPIYLCSDPSHLLKTARNSLFSSKPGGAKYMHKNGHDILWTHILDLFKCEQQSLLLRRCRLSVDHINLTNYSKMKVGLARDVLNWNVGQCLRLLPSAQGTAEFVLLFAKWFDIMNCGRNNAIVSADDHRLKWLQEDFIKYLQEWKREVEENHKGENKRLMAAPTLEALLFTTNNYVALAEQLLLSGKRVCFRVFTQDVLEAFFGDLRTHGRRSQNPDVQQCAYAFEHITTRKIVKKVKGGNTTYGKVNAWSSVCKEPVAKRKR